MQYLGPSLRAGEMIAVDAMSFEFPGAMSPEVTYCQYGGSRLKCRGPARGLDAPYVAILGGVETFGRFVQTPFVEQLERDTGRICVNLGTANAGVDAWLGDAALVRVAAAAEMALIQLPGAQMLSNPFYRVHPRRNDRFLEPLPALRALCPGVDFTEFTFVNHMLTALAATSPEGFAEVRAALQSAWTARMEELLGHFPRPPVLLWLRYDTTPVNRAPSPLSQHPALVGAEMVEGLRPRAAHVVALDLATASAAHELKRMRFGAMQAPAAAQTIGPSAHRQVAQALLGVVPALE
ncbi:hypothetical protein GCM10017056_44670 [Seohaeicola zhoushanensis]|uniref:DUF6473 domain-containing protein n=2 Tax=Seohaeicola zhoushanensis TaxID=1569283 RepID=A0A8J3H0M8_9RHOB|nr:hypothetical protein GCM10017056_44670 [Seohaeicola zhoushanensis]